MLINPINITSLRHFLSSRGHPQGIKLKQFSGKVQISVTRSKIQLSEQRIVCYAAGVQYLFDITLLTIW